MTGPHGGPGAGPKGQDYVDNILNIFKIYPPNVPDNINIKFNRTSGVFTAFLIIDHIPIFASQEACVKCEFIIKLRWALSPLGLLFLLLFSLIIITVSFSCLHLLLWLLFLFHNSHSLSPSLSILFFLDLGFFPPWTLVFKCDHHEL